MTTRQMFETPCSSCWSGNGLVCRIHRIDYVKIKHIIRGEQKSVSKLTILNRDKLEPKNSPVRGMD